MMLILPSLLGSICALGTDTANLAFAGRTATSFSRVVRYSMMYAAIVGTVGAATVGVAGTVVPGLRLGLSLPDFIVALAITPLFMVTLLLGAAESGRGRARTTNAVAATGMAVYLLCLSVLSATAAANPFVVFLAWVLAQLSMFLLLVRSARPIQDVPRIPALRTYMSYGVRTYGSSVLLLGLLRLDLPLVQILAGPFQVGIYSTVVPVGEVIFAVSTALTLVILPRVALRQLDISQVLDMSRVLFLVGLMGALPLVLAAPTLVPALFGTEFQSGATVLQVLLPGIVFFCASRPVYLLLVGTDRQLLASIAALVPLLLSVALDLVLVPTYGAIGAAAAATLSYVVHALLLWLVVARWSPARIGAPYVPTRQTVRLVAQSVALISRAGFSFFAPMRR